MLRKIGYGVLVGLLLAVTAVMVRAQPAAGELSTARLRAAHYSIDAPPVDVYVDGELVAEALDVLRATPHLDVETGTHEVVLVPTGEALEEAVLGPVEVELMGGMDYTLAVIGQVADASLQTLLLNETALVGEVRDPENPASYAVLLHGISDGPAIDFYFDEELRIEDLAFGEYGVVVVEQGPHDVNVTFADDPEAVIFQNSGETAPSDNLLLLTVMLGAYPDALDVSGAVSRLPDRTVIDFLADYEGAEGDTFATLLEAIEAADLTETLATEGTFTIFAPTDAAFAALPEDVLASLLDDPEQLRDLLLYHVSETVFTTRDLEDALTLPTLHGAGITVSAVEGGFTINAESDNAAVLFGGFPVVVNGNVIGIDRVLLPPEMD
ncbi:MAG: hypothetical protein OHK0046_09830 [Anaerolineae bacterium]